MKDVINMQRETASSAPTWAEKLLSEEEAMTLKI